MQKNFFYYFFFFGRKKGWKEKKLDTIFLFFLFFSPILLWINFRFFFFFLWTNFLYLFKFLFFLLVPCGVYIHIYNWIFLCVWILSNLKRNINKKKKTKGFGFLFFFHCFLGNFLQTQKKTKNFFPYVFGFSFFVYFQNVYPENENKDLKDDWTVFFLLLLLLFSFSLNLLIEQMFISI